MGERAPQVSKAVQQIVGQGSQILLPFAAGDASVTFSSRWQLAKLIEAAITEHKE